jgi:DNA-binding HxlR family transcriptional regulator
VLRGRWMPLVLLEFLRNGELSFSELAAALSGLSDKVLSERLIQLTDAGVLARHRTPGWPPRVRYVLTDRGRALAPVLEAMWLWGAGNG